MYCCRLYSRARRSAPRAGRTWSGSALRNLTWASACPAPDQYTKRRHVEAKENVAPLTADSMRLKQILLNLLSNACKFRKRANNRTHATQDLPLSCAPGLSLGRRPNFSVLVIHRVVLAKLTTRKSDGFVLSCKRTHRLAARTHEAPRSRQ